jgi:hypothetical protein
VLDPSRVALGLARSLLHRGEARRLAAVEDEVRTERVWRRRCGEPNRGRWPIRCRRDLNHKPPHAGLAGSELVSWPGEGNATSAHTGPGRRCWCRPG